MYVVQSVTGLRLRQTYGSLETSRFDIVSCLYLLQNVLNRNFVYQSVRNKKTSKVLSQNFCERYG